MTSPAITVDRVTKYYALDARSMGPGCGSPPVGSRCDPSLGFAALRDVSLTIPRGATTALVGKNGAGKTTMLRILAGIASPSEGSVFLGGRTTTLLSLRVGLNPRLSGRDNLYLYAALMGFDRTVIDERLSEIIDFAELADFVDMPFGSYSPGMSARLAFSAAVHLEADILLIDEILAVGDASFQERAAERMREYFSGGHSVVFSSHNLAAVQELCSHVVWFDEGRVRLKGPADEVLAQYRHFCRADGSERRPREANRTPDQWQERIATLDRRGGRCRRFAIGETLIAEYRYDKPPLTNGELVLSIYDPTIGKTVYRIDSKHDRRGTGPGTHGVVRCILEALRLPPRQYWIEVTRHGAKRSDELDERGELLARTVFILFDPAEAKTAPTSVVSTGYMQFESALSSELDDTRSVVPSASTR